MLPSGAMVPVKHLVCLHERLRTPLSLVQVVAHVPRPTTVRRHQDGLGGDDAVLSRLWLCKRHAESTQQQQHQRREQEAIEAVSRRVQWYWHDGQSSHAYNHVCNAKLEHGLNAKHEVVVLRLASSSGASTHTHTVQLHTLPMVVQETGARVARIHRVTCVTRSTKKTETVQSMFDLMGCLLVCFWPCRHPFPLEWDVHTTANYSSVELTTGDEFARVQSQLHASLPRAKLIRVTRCVCVWNVKVGGTALTHAVGWVMFRTVSTIASNGNGMDNAAT